jgi:hypothetical protein
MTPAAKNAVLGVALLGGAWGAYRYVYVPWKVKQEMLRQAAILAQQRGISTSAALKMLGTAGCQAVAVTYGVPPVASGGICSSISSLAAETVAQLPILLQDTGKGLAWLGAGTGSAISSIGAGTGSAVSSIGAGAASGVTSLAKVPFNVAAYGLSVGYGGVKTVVGDVYGGAKHVIHDLNPLNWF